MWLPRQDLNGGVDYTAGMRLVISGATGFLGRPLVQALRSEGHSVLGLTRSPSPARDFAAWIPDGTAGDWAGHLDGADGVINLTGESIGGGRWTGARKDAIRASRVLPTRSLVAGMRAVRRPPRFLLNASGIGYYGSRGDEILTEESGPGSDFLASICRDWEAEALSAEEAGARVALLRSGVVLHRDGGALEQMARPFKWFVGGRLGSGRQYLSWIHRDDWVALVRFIMQAEEAQGAFNVTAPTPAPNVEFADVLARALHRPAVVATPSFVLRAVLGEMADGLVLVSQRAVPARALSMGFTFAYPTLTEALAHG
jgi:uncharacterized protein (TIGR01777 family)